ncbi:MAG: (Fe-S)-binding protein [Bacteroidota bacterium]
MNFDWFVLPFSAGLLILFILVIFKFSFWIRQLPLSDRVLLNKGIFSLKIFKVCKEVVLESLLHRRIFKINPVLGFMHMSFAFGWFMLIVLGNLESRLYAGSELNLPYYAIFFKFFINKPLQIPFAEGFTFIMDFFLLLVLSGVLIAFTKRIYSKVVGLKRTTKLKAFDIFAMLSLWLIFPLRLFAESMAAGMYHTGGFLTQPLGNFFAGLLPLQTLSYIMWWGYSIALGVFFVCLPYSRYMHIPTEIILISFRHFGIRRNKEYDIFKDVEVFSCSRCGICIDKCQLNTMAQVTNMQSAYFIKSIRKNILEEKIVQNCLVCGRCQEYCPVGIKTDQLRLSQRIKFENKEAANFRYFPTENALKTDVLYFAGCMTHLTPSIKITMVNILQSSGLNYQFMDEDGSICCGRPIMLSGNIKDAKKMIQANKERILNSGAHTLVTSCPICLRIFKEDYDLGIKVLHHAQFIENLITDGKIKIENSGMKISYHDPCELGRGLQIYDEPRLVLAQSGTLLKNNLEKKSALCCGGSIANNQTYNANKDKISKLVVEHLSAKEPDVIATACPLCKKTLVKYATMRVADIAEITSEHIITSEKAKATKNGVEAALTEY